MLCPCQSQKEYADCCEPFIAGRRLAPTPEALMRSRYVAYTKAAMAYLKETLAPDSRATYNEKEAREWAEKSEWLGLEIHKAEGDKVEFTAKFKVDGKALEHHELARFRKDGDRWYFVDGETNFGLKPIVREEPKIGRNDPCSCGSGKKYKKCCGG